MTSVALPIMGSCSKSDKQPEDTTVDIVKSPELIYSDRLGMLVFGVREMFKKTGMTPPEKYGFQHIVDDCVTNGVRYLGIAMMPEERQSIG